MALHDAAKRGDAKRLQELLLTGLYDVNGVGDERGCTKVSYR
jgi:hypothetical protein